MGGGGEGGWGGGVVKEHLKPCSKLTMDMEEIYQDNNKQAQIHYNVTVNTVPYSIGTVCMVS